MICGYVVCKDGKCAGVYEKFPVKYKDLELRDLEDKLIIPGMVDLHIHAPQYVFRGMGMDYEYGMVKYPDISVFKVGKVLKNR